MADIFGTIDSISAKNDAGAWCEITTPDGKPFGGEKPLRIKVVGLHGDIYRERFAKLSASRREELVKNEGRAGAVKGESDEDRLLRFNVELLIALTLDWQNADDASGATLPCSQVNLQKFYSSPRAAFVRDQLSIFIATPANFGGDADDKSGVIFGFGETLQDTAKKLSAGQSGATA